MKQLWSVNELFSFRIPLREDTQQGVCNSTTDAVKNELKKMGYKVTTGNRTSGPINAIYFDWKHGNFWGGSSINGEDYGIGW